MPSEKKKRQAGAGYFVASYVTISPVRLFTHGITENGLFSSPIRVKKALLPKRRRLPDEAASEYWGSAPFPYRFIIFLVSGPESKTGVANKWYGQAGKGFSSLAQA